MGVGCGEGGGPIAGVVAQCTGVAHIPLCLGRAAPHHVVPAANPAYHLPHLHLRRGSSSSSSSSSSSVDWGTQVVADLKICAEFSIV